MSEPALRVRAPRPQETEATGERAEGSGGHQQNRLRGQVTTRTTHLLDTCSCPAVTEEDTIGAEAVLESQKPCKETVAVVAS